MLQQAENCCMVIYESPSSYTLAHLEYNTMATLHLFPFHVQLLACKRLVAMVMLHNKTVVCKLTLAWTATKYIVLSATDLLL